jgi:hypothetical protein
MPSLVLSQLDYGNALLLGLPKFDINRLQRVQNFAASVTTGQQKHESVHEELKQLHWLPVQQHKTSFKKVSNGVNSQQLSSSQQHYISI